MRVALNAPTQRTQALANVQTRAGHRLGFRDRAIRDKRRRIRANWSQGVAKTGILSPLQPEPFHSVEDIFRISTIGLSVFPGAHRRAAGLGV
jgi:hypothetical protein